MAHQIPFTQVPFRPITIEGNYESERPVIFHLSSASGPDKVRIQAIMNATAGLDKLAQMNAPKPNGEPSIEWPEDLQEAIVNAFRAGADLFIETVDGIENFTVSSALARKVGLIAELPPGGPDTPHPITTGRQFAFVAKYCHVLAFEVAVEVALISREAAIDPRFLERQSALHRSPNWQSGTAVPVQSGRRKSGTAGKPTKKGS